MNKLFSYFGYENSEETQFIGEPHESMMEIGPSAIDVKITPNRLAPINKGPRDYLYDSISFVIFCPKHQTIAVCTTKHIGGSSADYLPFVFLSDTISWYEAIDEGLSLILSDGEKELRAKLRSGKLWEACILHMDRTQLPYTQCFITRLISLVRVKSNVCCRKTSRLSWISLAKMESDVNNHWGIRVPIRKLNVDMKDEESFYTEIETDLEWVLKYIPRDPPNNDEEDMLKQLNITEKQIETVFLDFLEHCYPAFHMSIHSFKNYFAKYGLIWNDSQLLKYFNAFNWKGKDVITFHELLLGMACIEPDDYNGSFRLKFLFNYYNSDSNGFLNTQDFTQMIKDILSFRKLDITENAIKDMRNTTMKALNSTSNGVSLEQFIAGVNSGKFEGTTTLCRSKKQLFAAISNAMASRGIESNPELRDKVIDYVKDKIQEGVCDYCPKDNYEVVPIEIELNLESMSFNSKAITEIEDMIKKKSAKTPPKNKYWSQKYLKEVTLNSNCLAHNLVNEIRSFSLNGNKGNLENPIGIYSESEDQRQYFIKVLKQLAQDIIPILESEDRCIKVKDPVIVIGDIHGNLEDLLSIEKYLLLNNPISSANYLFLGDYVDRGMWSVECALFVICYKLISPTTVYLLRGNHETRVVQEEYTFKNECRHKYQSLGSHVFNIMNEIFDRLPFAAIIENAIFCCHGGIPSSCSTIKEINAIPKVVRDVEKESKVGWELLWNDPVEMKEFKQIADLLKTREDISRGFVANQKRGTAFYFNEMACLEFLENNRLQFLIRGHEVPNLGFKYHFADKKCLTVFSSSHYCGANNCCAVVHISEETIRIVSLDTTNNAPASEKELKKVKKGSDRKSRNRQQNTE